MKSLFSPYRIKNVTINNRILMPSLASFMFDENGMATNKIIEHYKYRASGGAAIVFVEACSVASNGIVSPFQGRIYHDKHTEGLSKIADVIKSEGCIPGLQLHHCGRQTTDKIINSLPVSPSTLSCPSINNRVKPLSILEIQSLVQAFGKAAERANNAGFQIIDIHGAHGYLINQFLSKFSNNRLDEYGKDIHGRSKFAVDIIKSVRSRVPEDIIVSFKISSQEFVPDGITIPESIEIIKILSKFGLDMVQVSAGNDATPEWIVQPILINHACMKDAAWEIKKATNLPTVVVGRINNPYIADKIIEDGNADLVGMGRGIIADHNMPNKARNGELSEIRPCIACNNCISSIFRGGKIECTVNPLLKKESKINTKQKNKKTIMVVGGGVAGMSAAWHSALRGHEVHLYEKEEFLGGQLKFASLPSHKKDIWHLIQFYEEMITRNKVVCHMQTEVKINNVKELDPDTIILSTGSIPKNSGLKGADKQIVIPITTALKNFSSNNSKVIIVGGGPTGCEVALHLSERGAGVTILEKSDQTCRQMENTYKKLMNQKLKSYQVHTKTNTEVDSIENNGIIVSENNTSEYLKADSIILAIGNQPENILYDELKVLNYKIHKIGDCLAPGNIKKAIHEGTEIGLFL